MRKQFFWLTMFLALMTAVSSCQILRNSKITSASTSATCTYNVVKSYPHDPQAFTQGLLYHEGELYESTGLHGKSSIRRVDLTTGQVQQQHNIANRYFGEGLALWQDRLIQLTWVSKQALVFDRQSFEQIDTFAYSTQGWGLTHNEQELIMSDGSDTLYFLEPDTFAEVRRIQVMEGGRAIDKLNELEYVRGEIWANVWLSDRIARIDPKTGKVLGWLDLTGIINPKPQPTRDAVLNGIAYDAEGDRLFVTGKLWPQLFEIKPSCP